MAYETEYKKGQYNFICDICGRKMKSNMMMVTWDNLVVCPDDFDPKHESLNPPRQYKNESKAMPDATGDEEIVFRSVNYSEKDQI